jgi:hypothetical protein
LPVSDPTLLLYSILSDLSASTGWKMIDCVVPLTTDPTATRCSIAAMLTVKSKAEAPSMVIFTRTSRGVASFVVTVKALSLNFDPLALSNVLSVPAEPVLPDVTAIFGPKICAETPTFPLNPQGNEVTRLTPPS